MSSAQKKAVSAHRQRSARKGLARIELQAPRADVALLKRIARALREDLAGANSIRALFADASAAASLTGTDLIVAMSIGADVDFPAAVFERSRDLPGDFPRDVTL